MPHKEFRPRAYPIPCRRANGLRRGPRNPRKGIPMKLLRMLVCATVLVGTIGFLRADEEKIALNKLPKAVLESVRKRFPKAELTSAEKETDDKKVVFEVLLKDGATTYELELSEDGTILVIDKLIEIKDLPKVVAETFATMYPKAKVKKVEEASTIIDGKEAVQFLVTIKNYLEDPARMLLDL